MAISIPVPTDESWSEVTVTMGGQDYTITYSFNERFAEDAEDTNQGRWSFKLSLNSETLVSSVLVMEQTSLLSKYNLDDFYHGDIYCLRLQDDGKPAQFDNVGIGKPYELVYLTNSELNLLSIT